MATDGGFKHIKVTPAEEQEVVIHAGASALSDVEPEAQPESIAPSQAVCEEPRAEAPVRPRKQRGASGYRATTLQDIESTKMSPMQIGIIVVAVLAIIAFAVWYAFFS